MQFYNTIIEYIKTTPVAFLVTNKYLYALLSFLIFVMIAYLATFIIRKYVLFLTRKTKTNIDDRIVEQTKSPIFYVLIAFGILIGVRQLALSDKVIFHTVNVIVSMIYLIFGIMFSRTAAVLIDAVGKEWAKRTKTTSDEELLPLIDKSTKVVIYIIVFILILKRWNIDVTGLMAGLGIAGIAIGFAVKDSLGNLFGGISLIIDKNFKVGDKIKIDSGETGIVEDIGLRSTRLRTFDNEILIMPNGMLANSKIQNFVLPNPKVRINVNFGVEYGTDIAKVKKVIIDAVKDIDNILDDPAISVDFIEMADSSLNFVCRIWVNSYTNAYSTKLKAIERIYNSLNKNKIGIPFPTRTVYLEK